MSKSLNAQLSREQQIAALEKDWAQNPRWKGIKRGYSAADVVRLRGSVQPEYTLAQRGAKAKPGCRQLPAPRFFLSLCLTAPAARAAGA